MLTFESRKGIFGLRTSSSRVAFHADRVENSVIVPTMTELAMHTQMLRDHFSHVAEGSKHSPKRIPPYLPFSRSMDTAGTWLTVTRDRSVRAKLYEGDAARHQSIEGARLQLHQHWPNRRADLGARL
jgi:hypothetical protein